MNRTDHILRDKLGSHKSPLPAGDWQDMRAVYISAYYKRAQRLSAMLILASLAVLALCFGLTAPQKEKKRTAKVFAMPETIISNEPNLSEAATFENDKPAVKQQIFPEVKRITEPANDQTALIQTEKEKDQADIPENIQLLQNRPLLIRGLGWKAGRIQAPGLVKDLPHTLSYPDQKFSFTPFVSYSYGLGGIKQKASKPGTTAWPVEFEQGNYFVETLSAEVGVIAGKGKSAFQYQIGLALTDQKIRGNYYLPSKFAFGESTAAARNNTPQLFSSYILSLPLSLSYHTPVEFCGFNTLIQAGAEPGYAFNQKGLVPDANARLSSAARQDFNTFSFAWKAGVGIGYSLNQKLDVKLLYFYNEQLTPFYSGSGVALKPYRHTVSLLFELGK